ncbi:MAG: hypothetical protein WCK02_15290 [Bacteroidota bacterium]
MKKLYILIGIVLFLQHFAFSQISGTKTVGATGADYPTLTSIAAALNASGVDGPLVIKLINTYSSAGETFPIVFNHIPGTSATNTIILKPDVSVSPVITGSNYYTIIRFIGTDYFTIDGSNNSSNSRDLTIINSRAAIFSKSGIELLSVSAAEANTNITIKNCNIEGSSAYDQYSICGIRICAFDESTASEYPNTNISITNNDIHTFMNGVFYYGCSSSLDQNVTISNNILGSATDAEKLEMRGIYAANINGLSVSGNRIYGFRTQRTVHLKGVDITENISASEINNNVIYSANTDLAGASGIYLEATTTASNLSIYNNTNWVSPLLI